MLGGVSAALSPPGPPSLREGGAIENQRQSAIENQRQSAIEN